jgi:hypothetical protein
MEILVLVADVAIIAIVAGMLDSITFRTWETPPPIMDRKVAYAWKRRAVDAVVCPGNAGAGPEKTGRADYGNQPATGSQTEPIDQSTLREAGSILNSVPGIVVEMNVDQFKVLQAEFETASNRLNEAKDLAGRQALLREIRQIIARMDTFVREMQSPASNSVTKRQF